MPVSHLNQYGRNQIIIRPFGGSYGNENKNDTIKALKANILSIGIIVGLRLHFSKHNPFSLRSLRTRRFNALPAAATQ